MPLALTTDVSLRTRIVRTLGGALIFVAAFVSVGLTAPADGPFTIGFVPDFLRLALDVDVKFGTMHLHYQWSAIPPNPPTTKPSGSLL
jgi:hypothetical protein